MRSMSVLLLLSFLACGNGPRAFRPIVKHECLWASNSYELDAIFCIGFQTKPMEQASGAWMRHVVLLEKLKDETEVEQHSILEIDFSEGYENESVMFYEDSLSKQQIIVWSYEGEYFPYYHIFMYHNSKIEYVGDISAGLYCQRCDFYGTVSQDSLRVYNDGEYLRLIFGGDLLFRGSEKANMSYHASHEKISRITCSYHYRNHTFEISVN